MLKDLIAKDSPCESIKCEWSLGKGVYGCCLRGGSKTNFDNKR